MTEKDDLSGPCHSGLSRIFLLCTRNWTYTFSLKFVLTQYETAWYISLTSIWRWGIERDNQKDFQRWNIRHPPAWPGDPETKTLTHLITLDSVFKLYRNILPNIERCMSNRKLDNMPNVMLVPPEYAIDSSSYDNIDVAGILAQGNFRCYQENYSINQSTHAWTL